MEIHPCGNNGQRTLSAFPGFGVMIATRYIGEAIMVIPTQHQLLNNNNCNGRECVLKDCYPTSYLGSDPTFSNQILGSTHYIEPIAAE